MADELKEVRGVQSMRGRVLLALRTLDDEVVKVEKGRLGEAKKAARLLTIQQQRVPLIGFLHRQTRRVPLRRRS